MESFESWILDEKIPHPETFEQKFMEAWVRSRAKAEVEY